MGHFYMNLCVKFEYLAPMLSFIFVLPTTYLQKYQKYKFHKNA